MNAIEVKDVNVYYDNLQALKDVNLTVKQKQFLGIIGPNGGGKSTLLKVMLGLIKPDTGYVRILGKNIKKGINDVGYVPQIVDFDRDSPFTVREVVLMGRLDNKIKLFRRFSAEDRQAADSHLRQLDLYQVRDRQIGKLSSGQLQKVLIARALAVEPRLILLDEPTASIDVESRHQIYSFLKRINREVTIVTVTHDIMEVGSYFDTIVCLNKEINYFGDKKLYWENFEKPYRFTSGDFSKSVFQNSKSGVDRD